MIVLYDTTGITIRGHMNTSDHVRIGVTQITLWKHGIGRHRPIDKPHVEFNGNDFNDLLTELERLP